MVETSEKLNIIELLMGIKEDVSSIKTEMSNFKEAQHNEREAMLKEMNDIRSDYKRDLADMETRVMGRINSLQSVQSTLVGEVDTLKHSEEIKLAKRWKTVVAFVCTAVGGMIMAKFPEILKLLVGGK